MQLFNYRGLSSPDLNTILTNSWSFLKNESAPLTTLTALLGVLFAIINIIKIAKDSRARTRPYISLQPALGVQHNGSIDLIIRNTGQSPAENITFKPLEDIRSVGNNDWLHPILKKFIGRELNLGPQTSIRIMWRNSSKENKAGAPEITRVQVTYRDSTLWRKIKPYKETITVDTSFVNAAPQPQVGPKSEEKDPHVTALENINHALRTLNIHIGNK